MAIKEVADGIVLTYERESPYFKTFNNQYTPAEITAAPQEVVVKQLTKFGEYKWWDKDSNTSNNQYPTTIQNGLNGCPAAGIALETLCVYTYGKGLGVFKRAVADGKETIVPVLNTEQLKYFRETCMPDYCIRAITDYWTFGNQFATLVKNRKGDKIALIKNTDANFCRLGWQNETTKGTKKKGQIDNVFISGAWHLFPSGADVEKVRLVDRYNAAEQLQNNPNVSKWIYRTYSYTPGAVYYHKHPWHTALDTGVFDIAPEIPKIRKNRLTKSLFVKYHVQINEAYWKNLMGATKWSAVATDTTVRSELQELKNKVYLQIDAHLGGTDNAYKSLFSDMYQDLKTGQLTDMIRITKVETDYGSEAAFDPDKMSNVADIFLAFGIPAPIMNTVLSDTKSRGGGSDIREGIIAFQQRLKWHRDNILAPIDFAMRFNSLLADDEFLAFEDMIPTTLDANPTGMQKTVAA